MSLLQPAVTGHLCVLNLADHSHWLGISLCLPLVASSPWLACVRECNSEVRRSPRP